MVVEGITGETLGGKIQVRQILTGKLDEFSQIGKP